MYVHMATLVKDHEDSTEASVFSRLFHPELLDVVGDFGFSFCKVTTTFNPTSTFSNLDLQISPHTNASDNIIGLKAKYLFAFDRLEDNPQYENFLKYIRNCKSQAWPPHSSKAKLLENDTVLNLCQHIFVPLSRHDEVFLEASKAKCHSGPRAAGIDTAILGMGTRRTWHGSPDIRVRGVEVLTSEDIEEEDVYDTDSTDGTSIVVDNIKQTVGTCVVSSFTEHNRHPEKHPIVPTVLINMKHFQVCFYDCERDILLISLPIPLANKSKPHLSSSALLLLWLTINYRIFFQPPESSFNTLTSTIISKLQDCEYLSNFKALRSKSVDWSLSRSGDTSLRSMFVGRGFEWADPPLKKKAKILKTEK